VLSVSFILFLLSRIAAVLHFSFLFADFASCVLFACMFFVCFIVCFSSTTFALVPLIIGRQLVELCVFLSRPAIDIYYVQICVFTGE